MLTCYSQTVSSHKAALCVRTIWGQNLWRPVHVSMTHMAPSGYYPQSPPPRPWDSILRNAATSLTNTCNEQTTNPDRKPKQAYLLARGRLSGAPCQGAGACLSASEVVKPKARWPGRVSAAMTTLLSPSVIFGPTWRSSLPFVGRGVELGST